MKLSSSHNRTSGAFPRENSGALVGGLAQDLRYAAVAVLTLALGIGANTAVFTIINTSLLNALPDEHASQLVAVNTAVAKSTSGPVDLRPISFLNLREKNPVFSRV